MTIYILCGIPASGKSTLSHELSTQHNAKLYFYDNLPNAHNPRLKDAVHAQMWASIAEDLRNGYDVVCDDLHTKREWRENILSALADVECRKILVVMTTPLDECLKRNANRAARLPDFVLHDLYEKYESPTLNEGWDEILYY